MLVGSLSHRYEWLDNWAKLPADIQLGYTHGVVVDAQDQVYLFNTSKDAVVVFDNGGNFLRSWGSEFAQGAHGILLNREGDQEYLYLVDTALRATFKSTLEGEVLLRIGTPDLPDIYDSADKFCPTDVAVAPNGEIYVTDGYGQSWIHQYNQQGERIRSFGGRGSQQGQLDCPHGIWIDTRGGEPVLYVADRANHRLQVFSLDGQPLRIVDRVIDYPCNGAVFGDEVVIPDLHSRVTILDGSDQLITHLGEDLAAWQRQGWPNRPTSEHVKGYFVSPHGAFVDRNGDIFVVEWVPQGRITKLRRVTE